MTQKKKSAGDVSQQHPGINETTCVEKKQRKKRFPCGGATSADRGGTALRSGLT